MVDLLLKVQLPLLCLSSCTLNFGIVYVGDTRKQMLLIENLSACEQEFIIQQKFHNKNFTVDQDRGNLPPRPSTGKHILAVTVSFSPSCPGELIEKLEIMTSVADYKEECTLYGNGSLDEKYHLSGL